MSEYGYHEWWFAIVIEKSEKPKLESWSGFDLKAAKKRATIYWKQRFTNAKIVTVVQIS